MSQEITLDKAVAAVLGLIGNVDHSRDNGPNAAKMRGEMLNDIRDILQSVDPVKVLALCEVEYLILKPDGIYKFVEMPDCEGCKRLADPNRVNGTLYGK